MTDKNIKDYCKNCDVEPPAMKFKCPECEYNLNNENNFAKDINVTSKEQIILDACCGSRMFHFNKKNPNVVFMDNRVFEDTLCDGRKLKVHPDIVADFRNIPFADNSFNLVIFDPPRRIALLAERATKENGWRRNVKTDNRKMCRLRKRLVFGICQA